jgi:MFS family permease
MTVASAVCALAPTITVMMAARFVQGFAGGWAMVIGRAVIVDLATGAHLVRVLNVIAGRRRHRPHPRAAARRGHLAVVTLASFVLGRRSPWARDDHRPYRRPRRRTHRRLMASLMIAGAAASMIGLLVLAKPGATPRGPVSA